MDNLLAGYGSDSEESSSSAGNGGDRDNQEAKAAAPISSLLGAGIDSDDSSSDDEENIKRNRSNEADPGLECHAQTTKKQRTEQESGSKKESHETSKSFLTRNGLPPPRTSSDAPLQSVSMVFWTTDYISLESQSPAVAHSTDNPRFREFEKLASAQSYDSKKGWAAHLRDQNEFHNPHFIQLVMDRLGIDESLGSQAFGRTTTKQSRFHS